MGCDIHGYLEVDSYERRVKDAEARWERDYEDFIKPLGDGAITKEAWIGKIEHRWNAKMNIRPLLGRNYDTFAFFFGVRRGRPEEHYGMPPIAQDRGFPEDASHYARGDYKDMEGDAHSATWISLDEIKRVDWNKPQGRIAIFVNDDEWNTLVKIMNLFDDGSGKNVRLVVWFDN